MDDEKMRELAEATIKRRARMREYSRQYRKEHPDRVMESKIRSAISLLTREGYTVKKQSNK